MALPTAGSSVTVRDARSGRVVPSAAQGNTVFGAALDKAITRQTTTQGASASQHNAMKGVPDASANASAAASEENLNERVLALHGYRLQLLASNIANADTPGYKAVDIDVQQALRDGQSSPSAVPLKFHVPSQGNIDGNTVELNVEQAKFAQSALMYQYAVDRVRGHYKDMEDLLKNTPY